MFFTANLFDAQKENETVKEYLTYNTKRRWELEQETDKWWHLLKLINDIIWKKGSYLKNKNYKTTQLTKIRCCLFQTIRPPMLPKATVRAANIKEHIRDSELKKYGFVTLHPTKGTLWVKYRAEKCFDSYGCPWAKKPTDFIINGPENFVLSELLIQTRPLPYYLFVYYIPD